MGRPLGRFVGARIGAITRWRRTLAAAAMATVAVALSLQAPAFALGPPTPGLAAAGPVAPSPPAFVAEGAAGGFAEPVSYNPLSPVEGPDLQDRTLEGVVWSGRTTLPGGTSPIEVVRGSLWPEIGTSAGIGIGPTDSGETRMQGQYGLPLGTIGHLRFHADGIWHDDTPLPDGSAGTDGDRFAHGGLRADMSLSAADALAVLGDVYLGTVADLGDLPTPMQPLSAISDLDGDDGTDLVAGSFEALWSRRLSPTSEIGVRSYLDHGQAGSLLADARLSTASLTFGHRFAIGDRNDVSWGFGYGVFHDHVGSSDDPDVADDSRTYGRFSSYLFDEVTLAPDALTLTVGTELEHDEISGFALQPSGRLSWRPAERHSLWTAVSRSVRTPSRSVANWSVLPNASFASSDAPTLTDPDDWSVFEDEELLAFRAGYATSPGGLSFGLEAFYNVYDNVRSLDFGEAETPAALTGGFAKPNLEDETFAGDVWGIEAAAGWQATDDWMLSAAYTLVAMDLRPTGGFDLSASETGAGAPVHEGMLRSSMRLDRDLDLDISFRTVDEAAGFVIGDYLEVGAELKWQPASGLELSIVGRNLLGDNHPGLDDAIIGAGSVDVDSSVTAALRIVF